MGVQFYELVSWARRRKVFASLLVVATLGIGIMIGTIISGRALATHGQNGASGASLLAVPDPITFSSSFSSISKKIGPAVVNISTTQVIEKPKGGAKRPHHLNDPFQDFFDRFFDSPDNGPDAERSLGSGVIVDHKGFILTNDHVIDQATKIQVAIDGDPRKYNAHLVGADKDTDLAVVKIDADRELPVAKLGNSDGMQVGDWVLAFGSPVRTQFHRHCGNCKRERSFQCRPSVSAFRPDGRRDQSREFRRTARQHGRRSDWH